MRAALDETAEDPVLPGWLFPSLRAWGEKIRPRSCFAGWQSPGSLCRAQLGAEETSLVSWRGAALLKLLGFGSKLLLHSLPHFSGIWLQRSNGWHNL